MQLAVKKLGATYNEQKSSCIFSIVNGFILLSGFSTVKGECL